MLNLPQDWIPPSEAYGMPLNETTIADHFKRAGFRTHAIGKVRSKPSQPLPSLLALPLAALHAPGC